MASLARRIVTAIQVGLQAFNASELTPSMESRWADRSARLARYEWLRTYRDQNPYKTVRSDRYKFMRNIDNPADTVVDFYVGQVYGGTITKDLMGGAIPIQTDNDALRDALTRLYRNSNWQADKSLFVRHGATYGDVAVKVVDDRPMRSVNLEVLHPGKIHTIERDSSGWITYARIEYDQQVIDPSTGDADTVYTYREDITPDEFRTFKDDEPFAYYQDANGRDVPAWRNEYGFVPVEVAQHVDVGLGWGVGAFYYAIPIIDEINDVWSILNDSQRKAVDIIWAFFGRSSGDITFSRSERDGTPMVYLGRDGKPPFAMVPDIDLVGANGNIDRLDAKLKAKLPELQLQELRQGGNLTAPGIRAGWSDAIDRVQQVRGSYDASTVKINKMGLVIGGMMGYEGFETVRGIRDLDDDRLEHEVSERPVIEDSLAQLEKVSAMQQVETIKNPELARAILLEMDIPTETVDKIIGAMVGDTDPNVIDIQPNTPQLPGQQPPQLTAGQGGTDNGNGGAVLDPEVQADIDRILKEVGAAA